jgi:chaperonin GroEL
VGATTEIEMKEKKLRVENTLNAAKAAVSEGIVPGGGITYIKTIPAVKAYVDTLSGDMKTGAAIILKALAEPARQIAENAGIEGSIVLLTFEAGVTGKKNKRLYQPV